MLPLGAVAAADPAPALAPLRHATAVERTASAPVLRLTGIVTSPTLHVPRAIIAYPGGGERSYRIGDTLPDGSTLAAIDVDRVVLHRGGPINVLRLEPSDDVPTARAAVPSRPSPQASSTAHDATPRAAAAAMRANPVLLLQTVPLEAIVNQYRMVALRVGKSDDASLMKELKLVPGDVITAINGVELNGPDQRAWMQSAPTPAHELTLKVYRDGRTETLRY
jgi:general secretion pathway protein C